MRSAWATATGTAEVIDLYPVGRALVLDIVVRALFGERMASRVDEIGELFQRPQDYLESPALEQIPHPLPAHEAGTCARRSQGARRDHRRGDRGAPRRIRRAIPLDVLESLVVDGSLSDAEIRDQVVTLLGAGYDTTSASLRGCCGVHR